MLAAHSIARAHFAEAQKVSTAYNPSSRRNIKEVMYCHSGNPGVYQLSHVKKLPAAMHTRNDRFEV